MSLLSRMLVTHVHAEGVFFFWGGGDRTGYGRVGLSSVVMEQLMFVVSVHEFHIPVDTCMHIYIYGYVCVYIYICVGSYVPTHIPKALSLRKTRQL